MVEIDEKQIQELEELIETLSNIKGRHTELVSVLIPGTQNIFTVANQLEAEKSTAENIKSKSTRKAVIEALEMIIRKLKEYKKTPETGLALYCGNISQNEGNSDIRLWEYIPARPLNVRIYRCDKDFIIEPLKEMLEVQEVYGLLAIDRQEATIGVLEGKNIKVIRKFTSGVPGKVRAGGQSSQRFHRITEGLAKEFFRRVAEAMKEIFFDMPKLKGILIGGPIPTKEEFIEEGQLVTKLKEKIISTKDIGYVDEHGLELLVEDSQEEMAEQELIKEKNVILRFFETLGKHSAKVAYGEERVRLALERGAVDLLIISKKLIKEEPGKVKEIEELAKNIGSAVVIIGNENQDAIQFYSITKGLGAILRFQLE
jgi:peptide chain release factor subunit 1